MFAVIIQIKSSTFSYGLTLPYDGHFLLPNFWSFFVLRWWAPLGARSNLNYSHIGIGPVLDRIQISNYIAGQTSELSIVWITVSAFPSFFCTEQETGNSDCKPSPSFVRLVLGLRLVFADGVHCFLRSTASCLVCAINWTNTSVVENSERVVRGNLIVISVTLYVEE